MTDSSVTQEVLHTGLFLIVGSAVVLAGWNEPLRYLVMKPDQILAEERAMFRPADGAQRSRMTNGLQGTALDRAPWRSLQDGSIIYSNDFDSRRMGPRTEVQQKDNIYKSAR